MFRLVFSTQRHIRFIRYNLREHYLAWDKAAKIDFVETGTGAVYAFFEISEEELASIEHEVEVKGKMNKIFHCEIESENGDVVAKVEKTLYIRKLK